MFDPYDSPLLLPPSDGYYELEAAPESDRIDYALEGISRFTGLFALGITINLDVPMGNSAAALLLDRSDRLYSLSGSPCLSISQCSVVSHRDRVSRGSLHGLV